MPVKQIAPLLICALILLSARQSAALAQARYADNVQGLSAPRSKPNSNLSTVFAEGVAKIKTAGPGTDDFRRLEKERLFPQSAAKPGGSGFSGKEKILAVVIVLGITALAIVLAHNGVDPKPRCEDEPGSPDCIQ
jgi:hypothetical protein